MSLLMDALKRAEKARQAQAAKKADGKGMSTSKLALDPIDVDKPRTSAPQEPPPEPPTPPLEPQSSVAEDPATTQFSLTDNYPATERVPPSAATAGEKLGPFSLVRDNELSLEETGEMLPVVRAAEKSLNEYFDDPDSSPAAAPDPAETSMDDKSTVVGGRAAREPESGSKRTAQSVFNAKAPAMARYQRNRTLMIALPLLLLGAIGIGVLLFRGDLQRTFFGAPPKLMPPRPPQTAQAAPPLAADTAAEAARLAAAAESAAAAQTNAATESSTKAVEAPGDFVGTETAVTAGASGSSSAAPVAGGAEKKIAAATPTAGGNEAAAAIAPGKRPPAQPPAFSQPLPPAVGRPYAAASGGGMGISRRSDPDRVHASINEAYLAFQSGDDATAWKLYSRVHRQHPKNRNALLGLGAIAVHSGNYAEAVKYYVRLLSIDPRDPIARAALINLNQSVPAGEGEGHVKRLLAEDSDQPFLHFTLGNLYARQGRWAEAQQAYFNAYRRDSNSGDYAFNLAVSLDRLGQPAAALTYYQRALVLASEGPASFEPRTARMRIERLTAGGQG